MGRRVADLDGPASCSALWLHALPYRGAASTPPRQFSVSLVPVRGAALPGIFDFLVVLC